MGALLPPQPLLLNPTSRQRWVLSAPGLRRKRWRGGTRWLSLSLALWLQGSEQPAPCLVHPRCCGGGARAPLCTCLAVCAVRVCLGSCSGLGFAACQSPALCWARLAAPAGQCVACSPSSCVCAGVFVHSCQVCDALPVWRFVAPFVPSFTPRLKPTNFIFDSVWFARKHAVLRSTPLHVRDCLPFIPPT